MMWSSFAVLAWSGRISVFSDRPVIYLITDQLVICKGRNVPHAYDPQRKIDCPAPTRAIDTKLVQAKREAGVMNSDGKVRWGIVSTADIGIKKVIPGIMKSVYSEVVAIASRDLGRAEAAAGKLGI